MIGEYGRVVERPEGPTVRRLHPVRWVRSVWEEGDLEGSPITFLWEFDGEGVVVRQVELAGRDEIPIAAASWRDFWEAQQWRYQAATPALVMYQKRYGGVAEGSERDWGDYPHEAITSEEFEEFWRRARAALEREVRSDVVDRLIAARKAAGEIQ